MTGLGEIFLSEIIKCLDRIVEFPHAWHAFSKSTRRIRTKRFPYGLIYHMTADEIILIAVAHLHRKPGYWKKRI